MSDPIDLDHLAQYTAGDAALEAELMGLFCEQARQWLRALAPDADDDAWGAAAHTLKGTARAVGAHRMAAACEAAEALVGPRRDAVARSVAAQDVRAAAEDAVAFAERIAHHAKVRSADGAA